MGTSIVIAAAVLLVMGVVLIFVLRSKRIRFENDEAFVGADNQLEKVAETFGWKLELHPTPSLWYRLRGTSASGVAWEIVEGPPSNSGGVVTGGGARWVTEAVRSPALLIEVLPTPLYHRMGIAIKAGNAWDPSWSMATKQLMTAGRPVPFTDPWLAQRLTCVAVVPATAETLFSADVMKAMAQLKSSSLRVSLGMPNLRLAVDGGAGTPTLLPALVAAGVALADRYRELDAESKKPVDL